MKLKGRLDYFCQNYDLVFFDTNFTWGRKYIGKKRNKKCRFCNNDESTVTFRTKAHAVPEFLGNKKYISFEECDNCNKFFSEALEDNLDKFTKPYRTIAKIKGKKKIPSYKSKDKKTWLGFKSKKELLLEDVVDSGFIDFDFDKKKIVFRLKLEPFIPTAVYKCLVKIALSLLPQHELFSFQRTIKWIRHKDHSKKILNPQIVFSKFVPGVNPNKGLSITIIRRKESSKVIPYCWMVLAFGNFIYQLIIPSQNDFVNGNSATYTFYSFPSPWERNGIFLVRRDFDLSSHKTVAESEESITFTYDKIEKFDNEDQMKTL